ncbi:MAG: DUF3738 domain-containing protein [Pedosphaera sp.]|nr:DUF3738 domain-containing protein [Pedosphaera sp.]
MVCLSALNAGHISRRVLSDAHLDRTGLAEKYDFAIQWDEQWWFQNRDDPEGLKKKLLDQLGLELVASREPIEMLIVEKAK